MMQRRERRDQVLALRQAFNRSHLRPKRAVSEGVDSRRIHARGKVIAHLLLHRCTLRRLRIFFQNAPQKLLIVLPELRIYAPGGLVGGNGIVLHPSTAGKLVEIVTGLHRLVETSDIERRRIRHRGKWLRRHGHGSNLLRAKAHR